MRLSNLQKNNRSWGNLQGRSYSPNSFNRPNFASNNDVSVHSEHLRNMMDNVKLFPEEISQLLRYQERNLSNYKKALEREKIKVNGEVENLKKQIIHNIDDLKISIFAELDRIYRNYMEKYATLKGQIMQIKRLKDKIEMDLEAGSKNFIPKYATARDKDGNFKSNTSNNTNIMKSLEKDNFEANKYHMLNYIAELQREKIMPLTDLTKELIVLTQYENGYYQNKEFQGISSNLINQFKGNLRSIYDRKYEFIREPEQICQKEEVPILEGIYEQPTVTFHTQPIPQPQAGNLLSSPTAHFYDTKRNQASNAPKIQETKILGISQQQQNLAVDWAESISLTPTQTIRSISDDIVLCAVQVSENIIAVGGKDGVINVYQIKTGKKIANMKGHRASICKLAIVVNKNKRYLASGSDQGCSSIVLWDTSSWNMSMRIQGHKGAVTAIVDLQDNRSLISGSYDKSINIYNLNDEGKIIYNLPSNGTSVTAILLNCNQTKVISCGLDNTICVWQIVKDKMGSYIETMFMQRTIRNSTMICSIVASMLNPDVLFIGGKDGMIKLINIEKKEVYRTYSVCNNAVIEMVALQRQSKQDFPLIICWENKEECLKIINTETGRVTNVPTRGFIEFSCGVGPKGFFLSGGRTLAMLSQSKDKKEINLYKLDL